MSSKQWMTFGVKVEGADKASKDVDKVGKSFDKTAQASKKTGEETKKASTEMKGAGLAGNSLTAGLVAGFRGAVGGIKTAVLGMKTLKGAMISTGIGALVVLVGSLIAYFTKKGAEILEVASAALGAVFGVLTDVLSKIGETMVWAFSSPQEALDAVSEKMEALGGWFSDLGNYLKEVFFFSLLKVKRAMLSFAAAGKELLGFDSSDMRAEIASIDVQLNESIEKMEIASDKVTAPLKEAWETVTEGVSNFVKSVEGAIGAAARLQRDAINLREAQRSLNIAFAEGRAQIREYQLVAEDTTKGLEERIEAATKAGEIETELAKKREEIAAEALRIHNEQMAITESLEEDYDKRNELEVALINIRTESARIKKAIMMKEQTLRKEQETNNAAAQKVIDDAEKVRIAELKAISDAKLNEEQLAMQKQTEKYDKLIALAVKYGQDSSEIEEQKEIALEKIRAKFAKKETAEIVTTDRQRLEMAGQALGALSALNKAFAKDGDEGARKAFKRNKALSMSTAILNTALAISDALAKDSVTPFSRYVSAGIAGAMGIAQVATIAKTQFQSTTPPDDPDTDISGDLDSGVAGFQDAGGGGAPPSIDFGFLGEGAGGGVRAYVINEDVSNGLQAEQKLIDQTTL